MSRRLTPEQFLNAPKWLQKFLIKQLKKLALKTINTAEKVDDYARQIGQENEQWFLNYQDELNHISVLC